MLWPRYSGRTPIEEMYVRLRWRPMLGLGSYRRRLNVPTSMSSMYTRYPRMDMM